MAESNETIRQMLAGFSAMQFNLGLLPMQGQQSMAGAPPMAAPPAPHIPHPAEAAARALQQQQAMIQQTLQAAQVTRYQPPPSAPMPAVSAMGGFAAMGNPFAASSMGIGGVGGAFSPAAGRNYASPGPSPYVPSVFNPFAPSLPAAHFASPGMRSLQIMNTNTSQTLGMFAGLGEGAMGLGGAIGGGMLGGMAGGPLGAIGGALLGRGLGGGISNMVFGPALADQARGRMIQNMSAPWMVSGAHLNAATGQGFSREAGVQIATGIRQLGRDHDFERTGFNTQDALRIMQSAGGAGMLTGAASPDALVAKVKEISKTVKVLMRITGDPDVQSAIQSLAQMKDLGFTGLSGQAGAVANRAMFARMAGVSQAGMDQMGMAGAGLAGQYGLAGATGYSAGMAGAAQANLARSSGALNALQMARAGGVGGLGQINAAAGLAAMNDDRYLLAALGRDKNGKMTVDADAYRRAHGMSFEEVTKASAEALRNMGSQGIFEWNTRRQEFKDSIAQKLSPMEMQMNAIKQAQAFRGQFGGSMSLGTALQQTTGMSAEQARALELQAGNRDWYTAQIQQLEAQKRGAMDQQRAARDVYRTPGLGTRMSRGVRGFFSGISDAISSPFSSLARDMERADEEEEAASRGELISRYSEGQIARSPGERAMLRAAMRNSTITGGFSGGRSVLDGGGGDGVFGRNLNRLGSAFGFSPLSDENRLVQIASRSRSRFLGNQMLETFGDKDTAIRRIRDVNVAADAWSDAEGLSTDGRAAARSRIRATGVDVGRGMDAARSVLRSGLADGAAGTFDDAEAMGGAKLRAAGIALFTSQGKSAEEAARLYDANARDINALLTRDVMTGGSVKDKEQFMKSLNTQAMVGGVDFRRSTASGQQVVNSMLEQSGLRRNTVASEGLIDLKGQRRRFEVSDAALDKLKASFGATDVARDKDGNMTQRAQRVMAMVAVVSNEENGTPEAKAQAAAYKERLRAEVGPEEAEAIEDEAREKLSRMGADERKAMRQTLNVGDASGLEKRITNVDTALQARLYSGTMKAGLQKLSSLAGGDMDLAADGGDFTKILDRVTDAQLEKIRKNDPALAKRIDKMRSMKGEARDSEARDILAGLSPEALEERSSVGAGSSVESINKQIGELRELRDKLGTEEGSEKEQVQAASTKLFSSSVERFGKFVEQLTGETQNGALDYMNPAVQSRLGGS